MVDQAEPEPVIVGRVLAAYGIKGWNRVQAFTENPASLGDYPEWLLRSQGGAEWRPVRWEGLKKQGKHWVVRLEGSTDRDQAEQSRGCDIAIRRDALPELDAGEYYWHQLIGLTVQTAADALVLGKVTELLETGSNDVLVVVGQGMDESIDERERLIPYRPEVVLEVRLDSGLLVVDWDPEF